MVSSMGIDVRGDFEALICDEVAERLAKVLAGKSDVCIPKRRNNPDFPLRRFVRCGSCATPLTGSWSKGRSANYAYYHCRKCGKVRIGKTQLEGRFVDLLLEVQPTESICACSGPLC